MADRLRLLAIQDVEGMEGPFYFRYDDIGADTHAASHSHTWGHLNYAAHGTMQMDTEGLRFLSPPQYAVWIPPKVVHSCTLRHAIVYRSIYIAPGLCGRLPAEPCTVRISPIIKSVLADFAARDLHVPRTEADLRLAHVVVDQLALAEVQRCYLPAAASPALVGVLEALQAAPGDHRPRRRALLGSAAVALLAATGGGIWLDRRSPLMAWSSDLRTGTGERRRFALEDGSDLLLNARSSADLYFSSTQRLVRLRAGALIAQVAADALRPFVVQTAQGTVRALGTRFVVRRDAGDTSGGEGRSQLEVLAGAVEVRPARAASAPVVVPAGQRVSFTADAVGTLSPVGPGAGAWARGVLYAEEMPLGELLAEIARYRSGVLRCDPAVAGLRVSGAFQLTDTDRILSVLAQTLPVRVDARTRYWVTVSAR